MITKEHLSNYAYLEQCINETKKKIEYYKDHPPVVEYGKVYGSSNEFPYTLRSFSISGYNGPSEDKWRERIRKLHEKLVNQVIELEKLKLEIEEFIHDIPDLSTRLIFTYIFIDGMTQDEVARKMHLEQCTISKRITRYLDSVKVKN